MSPDSSTGASAASPKPAVISPGAQLAISLALLILAPLAIYAQTARFTLVQWDDPQQTVANPHVRPPSWRGIVALWSAPYFAFYVPVSYTFFAGETWLAERCATENPPYSAVYHLGSLGLHVVNGLLVFAVLRRFIKSIFPAAAGALLFSLHPLQVESVAWITGTLGLLSAAFSLCSIWCYIRFADAAGSRPASQVGTVPRRVAAAGWYLLALVAFVLALLSKPSAVAVPLMLMAIDLGLLCRPWPKVLLAVVPWLALSAAVVLLTKGIRVGDELPFIPAIAARPRLAGDAIAFYLYKLAWPWSLAADYARPAATLVGDPATWITALLPIALAIVLAVWRRWMPLLALVLFVAAVLPMSGLLAFGYQGFSTVADRYVYLALLAPAVLAAWWLSRTSARWPAVVTYIALAVLGVKSFVQAGHWRDDASLFGHTLVVSPRSFMALNSYGLGLMQNDHLEEALEYFLAAESINPQFPAAYNNAGITLGRLGRWPEAAEHLHKALKLSPQSDQVWLNLAAAQIATGKSEEAARSLVETIRLNPANARAHLTYGVLLTEAGRADEALSQLNLAIEFDPANGAAWYAKGQILAGQNKLAEAEKSFRAALQIDSRDEKAREALKQVRARRRAT